MSYQQIDSAAHAVVPAVIAPDGAVVKETEQETLHQGNKALLHVVMDSEMKEK